jgi:hypothetical protein
MSYEDRRAIVSAVQETYGLTGRALGTEVPSDVIGTAVRPEIMQQLQAASIEPYVTDGEMLDLLREAYFDLVDQVLLIQRQLLGESGESFDGPLAQVHLTGSGQVVKVRGWRRALQRVITGIPGVKKALQWGNIILGSLGSVPVVGTGR